MLIIYLIPFYNSTVACWSTKVTHNEGINSTDIFNLVAGDIAKWQDAADVKVDGQQMSIFGNGILTNAPLDAGGNVNGLNEVVFGSVDSPGAIAVTVVICGVEQPVLLFCPFGTITNVGITSCSWITRAGPSLTLAFWPSITGYSTIDSISFY
ncbi:MAG: hypothetical protein H6765_01760 [Candidatus Peribacteria bacterium]|nr:MAG: hypothetical protein H6765_01760 [Candidatus Peribacteria bacterium]